MTCRIFENKLHNKTSWSFFNHRFIRQYWYTDACEFTWSVVIFFYYLVFFNNNLLLNWINILYLYTHFYRERFKVDKQMFDPTESVVKVLLTFFLPVLCWPTPQHKWHIAWKSMRGTKFCDLYQLQNKCNCASVRP